MKYINTKDKYLKANKRVRDIALSEGLKYCTQFSYQGPAVTRTKFWCINSKKSIVDKVIKEINKLDFVEFAKYNPQGIPKYYGYGIPDSIYIRYKK